MIDFPPQRPLDADFVHYIQRKLIAGLVSEEAAVAALRARDPEVTAERVQALLMEGDR